jgi:outer membrane protein OmpA-like peptidoglycan-associated protein
MGNRKQRHVAGIAIAATLCWLATTSPSLSQDDGNGEPQAGSEPSSSSQEGPPTDEDKRPRKGKTKKQGQGKPPDSEPQDRREFKQDRAQEEKLKRQPDKAAEEEIERQRGKLERDKAAEEKLKRQRDKAAEEERRGLERGKATEEQLKRQREKAAEEEIEQRQKLEQDKAGREKLKRQREKAADEEIEQQRKPEDKAAEEQLKRDKAAEEEIEQRGPRRAQRLEELKRQRKESVEEGGKRIVIEEPDSRVIVKEQDRLIIRHDETERFRRKARDVRERRRPDGIRETIFVRPDGAEIVAEYDAEDRLLRRLRRERGREYVIIDNRDYYGDRDYDRRRYGRPGGTVEFYVDLPPLLEIGIPREKYIVEYDSASEEDLYEALTAPPLEELDRGYALEEIKQSYDLRERMRSVDLDTINFEFGSWQVDPEYYDTLERLAEVINRILEEDPEEVFLIEAHSDAVGSEIDNLSLSDRRAEAVAIILTDTFSVPAENLVTQGYGEQFLKIQTELPERENRRVSVRRIKPLMSSEYSSR